MVDVRLSLVQAAGLAKRPWFTSIVRAVFMLGRTADQPLSGKAEKFEIIMARHTDGDSKPCFIWVELAKLGLCGSTSQSSLHALTLHGPTNFAPIIRRVTGFAERALADNVHKYFVLLIITDGDISDMEETKAAVIRASHLPVSIVIVGVGSSQFSSMNALDSDQQLLQSGRFTAARDIVQFVPFNSRKTDPSILARELLAEIPEQLVGGYKLHGIKPNPPISGYWVEL